MKTVLYFSLLGLFLTSCATNNPTALRPVSGQIARIDGRDVTKNERDNIEVVAAYEGLFFEYYLFDIEVKNHGQTDWQLRPADFYAQASQSQKGSTSTPLITQLTALDPQQRLLEVQQNVKRAKRRHTFNTVLNVGLVVANVAISTSSGGGRSGNDYWRRAANYEAGNQAIWVKQAIDNDRHAKLMQRLTNEKGLLQTDALPETTIPPNGSKRGLLLLKAQPKAQSISLFYPVADSTRIGFEFEQKTLK